MGGTGPVPENLANVSVGTERRPAGGLERDVYRWQFCPRQKGGAKVGKTKRGKGTQWMLIVDGQGLPLGSHWESASPAEVRLAEKTLSAIRVPRHRKRPNGRREKPQRLIGDKAYDSDPLRARLKSRGIELIVPHKTQSRSPSDPGWSFASPLPPTLDRRTNHCVAGQLPPLGGSLGSLPSDHSKVADTVHRLPAGAEGQAAIGVVPHTSSRDQATGDGSRGPTMRCLLAFWMACHSATCATRSRTCYSGGICAATGWRCKGRVGALVESPPAS